METNYKLIHNREQHRYEFHIDRFIPLIEYAININGNIYLTHTEVPKAIGGLGIGTQLVKKTLEDIDRSGGRIVPLCPFVVGYIKKNPQWIRIVAARNI